jgi:hypothetical protein
MTNPVCDSPTLHPVTCFRDRDLNNLASKGVLKESPDSGLPVDVGWTIQ